MRNEEGNHDTDAGAAGGDGRGEQLTLFPLGHIFDDMAFDAARELVEDFGGAAVAEAERRRQRYAASIFTDYHIAVRRAVKFILRGGGNPMT